MIRTVSFVALAAVLAVAIAIAPRRAPGCASAPPRGERVEIASESALIVWDEASKTEHFIRRANFRSTTPEFGFLVPTPSQPDLGEADDGIFDYLATLTAPKHENVHVKRPRPRQQHGASASNAMDEPGRRRGVEVLEEKQVGGMDAVVVKFHRGAKDDDPAAAAKELADWLAKRGYEFGPTLVNWLKPYIANDWVMTAFRIAGGKAPAPGSGTPKTPAVQGVRSEAVRMSFKTDRPFYPYREPVAEKQTTPSYEPRLLRVYFLADKRYAGMLGEGKNYWPGGTMWSDKLPADQLRFVESGLKLQRQTMMPTSATWLTEFEDHSTPRPGTDEVYFNPAESQEAVARPPIIHEIIEWYDEPEPEKKLISETGQLVLVFGLIGLGALGLVARLLYGLKGKK